MAEQNRRLAEVIVRERGRLRNFIRQRVPDASDAEDILQDVFFEFITAWRLPEPIEQAGAWLFRVARNRIVDRFRKKREVQLPRGSPSEDDEDDDWLGLALPAVGNDPESAYLRAKLIEAIADALAELPDGPRTTFIAHELDGIGFKEQAAASGVNINTLLGWKRQAVQHLRIRLQTYRDENV